jgi:hypothetical protein
MKALNQIAGQQRAERTKRLDDRKLIDGRLRFPRSAGSGSGTSDLAWYPSVSGATITIAEGMVRAENRFISPYGPIVLILTGGTLSSPHWIVLRVHRSEARIEHGEQASAPNPTNSEWHEWPLCRAYKSGASAVILDPKFCVGQVVSVS